MDARFLNLRTKVEPLLRPFARRISVFGSFARGDSTAQSDVDLLGE
jgi:predicted nucleotidyltransferase